MLRQALEAAIPTMPQLAKAAGVTYSALRAYRRGERTPAPAVIHRIARALREHGAKVAKLADELERAAHQPTKGRKP